MALVQMSACFLRIQPRFKQGDQGSSKQVLLSAEYLEDYFAVPLNIAAKQIGISETTLKW